MVRIIIIIIIITKHHEQEAKWKKYKITNLKKKNKILFLK